MRGRLLSLVVMFGCAGSRQEIQRPQVDPRDPMLLALTAGAIGCPPEEISVGDYQVVFSDYVATFQGEAATWSAACRGKRFYCTASHVTQCHELIAPVVATVPN